jgi:hypothetical protein
MIIDKSGFVLLNLFIREPITSLNYIWNQDGIGFSLKDWK